MPKVTIGKIEGRARGGGSNTMTLTVLIPVSFEPDLFAGILSDPGQFRLSANEDQRPRVSMQGKCAAADDWL